MDYQYQIARYHSWNNPLQTTKRNKHPSGKSFILPSLYLMLDRRRNVFNSVVGAVGPGITAKNIQPMVDPDSQNDTPEQIDGIEEDQDEQQNLIMRNRLFFLDAPGGTGKTFSINAIQNAMKVRVKKVIAVATSAVAAQVLKGGRKAHSTFRIPVPCGPCQTCNVSVSSVEGRKFRDVHVIIWDEIVMAHRHCIEALDKTLRDIMGNDLPFGGKVVLFPGDFRQILPVVPCGSRGQIVDGCFRSSALFNNFSPLQLTENMRLSALIKDRTTSRDALDFPSFLLKVGEGNVPDTEDSRIKLPESVKQEGDIKELFHIIFEDIGNKYNDVEWLKRRAILTTRNSNLQ